jgi:cell division protein FtsW (lipid II flippase)
MATVVSYTARPRRFLQAVLLLAAVGIGSLAYALVGLGRNGALPSDLTTVVIGALALAVVLQIAVMWRASYADPVILPIVVLINLIGITVIHSVDTANRKFLGTTTNFAGKQMIWAVIGVVLAVAVLIALRDHRILRRYTWVAALVGAVLLLMPLAPVIGTSNYGARIWINVAGYSFQPAELAKIFFAIFFAGYLVSRRDTLALAGPKILGIHLPRWSDFGPILVAWGFSIAILVFETDLGTSLMFFGLFVAMLYVATDRLSWLVIGAVMFIPPAIFTLTQVSHVRHRMDCWLDPLSADNYSGCEQIAKGLFGLANGGIFGTGLGEGRPNIVPFAQSDFVFTSLAEEMGMVGCLRVAAAVPAAGAALDAYRGRDLDGFGTLLAAGLGFVIALQVFVVIGGITRVIPLTGLTLPFLAAGGSSLVCNWIIAALLVRMSDAARRPAAARLAADPSPDPDRADEAEVRA